MILLIECAVFYAVVGLIVIFISALFDDQDPAFDQLMDCYILWPLLVPQIAYELGAAIRRKIRRL